MIDLKNPVQRPRVPILAASQVQLSKRFCSRMSEVKLYVAESGSDDNKGLEEGSPLKTVIAALFINDKVLISLFQIHIMRNFVLQ